MKMICLNCPRGCQMAVTMKDDILKTTGHSCSKGIEFAKREWYHPVRILTTTVRTDDDKLRRVPVRTTSDIPKDKLMDAMAALDAVVVTLPIVVGTVIVKNLLNLGTDVIATFSMQPISR